MSLIVVRTCTPVLHERGAEHAAPGAPAPAAESRPLAACRDASAYVLLGDPGAGKTTALRSECAALGCEHAVSVDARDFLTFDPKARAEWRGKTLFIDGLDEVRAGASDARTPFDAIRERLDALGRPRFRLSCRAADWLGGNDRDRLQSVAPDGRVTVLALDPLTSDDVLRILDDRNVPDAAVFIESAAVRGLDALLANPQSLGMLADAVGSGGAWPESRRETFERACRSMVEEINEEHRVAPDARPLLPVELVDAAGRLCAGLLLADCDGCTLRGPASSARYPVLDHCIEASEGAARSAAGAGRTGTGSAVFRRALATRLFTSPDGERCTPVHRHVAEFLAARHAARLIEDGLPVRRVVALIAGGDGKVVTPLRGFAGWLAALCGCPGVRRELIDRDPVGVALYGDARGFPRADKRRLLEALHREAPQLAEFPSASGAGAFVTADLEPALREILSAPRRAAEHQRFAFFVLRAAAGPLPGVSELLLEVVRDDGRYPDVRAAALWAFMRTAPDGEETPAALAVLLDEVRRGVVSDPDDELRDMLLAHLYPDSLPASRVLDYLTDGPGRTSFWHSLPERAPDADVAVLLDHLAHRRGAPAPAAAGPGREATDPALTGLNTLDLLARGLEAHGDALDAGRLWGWLGAGLVSRSYAESLALLEDEDETGDGSSGPVPRVRAWLAARPDRQKAIVAEGLRRWTASGWPAGGPRIDERLYEADPPSDLGCWCLDEALVAADPRAADWLLGRALHAVDAGAGAAGLSIDRLRERTCGHERLREQLDDMLTSPVDAGRSARRQTWLARDEQRRQPLLQAVRAQEAALRENRCPPGVLRPLAAAWFGLLPEITGDDARTRLRHLLAPDAGLVDAALAGLRGAPARTDVPSAEDVIQRAVEGEEYHLALPVLAGVVENDAAQADCPLPLDGHALGSALAFYFTKPVSGADRWYRRVVRSRPENVADVLCRHGAAELRQGSPTVPALDRLATDVEHREVAARAALPLLRSFPTRCRNAQVGALTSLLWAALRWADRFKLSRLIERKLGARSMNAAQRTPWLAAGLVTEPDRWRGPLEKFVRGRDARIRQLAAFFVSSDSPGPSHELRTPEVALLIRLLGPTFSPSQERDFGGLSLVLDASIGIRELLNRLAASPDPAAGDALADLADLASDSSLSAWRDALVRKRDEQRVVHRDAHYRPPGMEQVCRTLANGPPANAGDLAALLADRLHEIAAEVRTGNANGWRPFWNEGTHREPDKPKHENSCRDALLHLLRQRLPRGVDAQPEGQYANERRADVRVACRDFQVPIEIKKNTHRDLWSAMRGQLLAHYTQDPATDGCGIYLVFWFGADDTPPPPDGPPPRSAPELEARLTESLSAAEARRITVRVIEVTRPVPRADVMKRIRYVSTLFFYDGPQIIEARDAIGGHYVGLATPQDGVAERYVLVGVDPERLRQFRSGKIDLRSLLLESDEETRYIAMARTSFDQLLALENLTVSLEDSGLLPDAGFFLHGSPTGDLVLKEARERNNLILEIAAEPPEAATQHRIRANTLAEMLFRVQAMVRHAYRAAMTEERARNRRPDDDMMDVVVPAAAGSFRIFLEAADMPNLFGHSALGMALQKMDVFFRHAADPEEALAAARESRGHLAGAYLKLLRFLDERKTGFRYSWAEPSSERPSRGGVSHAQAASLVEALSSVTDIGVEAVTLEGTFEKFNRGTGAWGLLTAEGPRSGRMREGSADLDGLEVGGRYIFHCDEVIEEVDVTGRELRTLYLHRHETA